MTQKTFYYHFDKIDSCFWSMVIELAVLVLWRVSSPWALGIFVLTTLVWVYKNFMKQQAVVITDKGIKIDHSAPLAWKDVKSAEIKEVVLGFDTMKILSLIPKKDISYSYNYLQTHNGDFGAFPIPLYGVLTPSDESEIIRLVRQKVTIKDK